jgi:peptidyl-prolyl cis-trans isomerase SurA
MKHIFLLLLLLLSTCTHAQKVDAIAIIVENQIITTKEIDAVQKQLQVTKQEATELLIENRLEHVAISKIEIEETFVDDRIAKIAKQNRVTVKKMQRLLKEQGTNWTHYKTTIRNQLKKERFFQENIMPSLPNPSTDELKLFYKQNRSEFSQNSFQKAKDQVEHLWRNKEQERMMKEYFKKLRTSVQITKLR